MRILILTKRQYTGKDLLDDRYGRLYEIPAELAGRGHHVAGICLSYRSRQEGHLAGPEIDQTLVNWYSWNIGAMIVPGLVKHLARIKEFCQSFAPDVILACSDVLQILTGTRLADTLDIPIAVDLYDNFESFGMTRIPGLLNFFRRAVRWADGVTVVSRGLEEYVRNHYCPQGIMAVVENGVSTKLFRRMDRSECRRALGLPLDARIIGTAGALEKSRGIATLFKAFEMLVVRDPAVHLAIAGSVDSSAMLPRDDRLHYLGNLPYGTIPRLFNALDVGVICNRDTSFGRYCYPQKAQEMFACQVPVVAAGVGTMTELFSECSDCLYIPGDCQDLAEKLRRQLSVPVLPPVTVHTWSAMAKKVESLLSEVCSENRL